jgi:outer membrane receptor protein involved in Fe transport
MSFTKQFLLGTTTLVAAFAFSVGAYAQQASAPSSDQAGLQEVVVTGSHIPRPNLDQPTPVSTISEQFIENAGTPNLGDILAQLPAVGFNNTVRANSNSFGNNAGLSLASLRDLGPNRTLVLVDGQRHVAGDISTNAVDLNSIPSALVDHVEVITGGASAIYGSDAVTGVINIILKKSFDGIEANAEVGGYDEGYGQKYSANFTAGHNFLDGKLNIALTGYYTKEAGIDARNIPGAASYGTITNPNDIPPGTYDPTFYSSGAPIVNDGKPDNLYVPNVGSEFVTRNGVLLSSATFLPQFSFNAAGQLVPVPTRTGFNSFAFGQLPANCADCYFTDQWDEISSATGSEGGNLNAHYEFNPHLHASLDAKFAETDTVNVVQPSYDGTAFAGCTADNYYCQLQPDNAFIKPDLAAALAGTPAADYPLISKFLNNGRAQDITRQTYRIVAGLNGDFNLAVFPIKWNANVNYGETDSVFDNKNLEILENFDAAIDSVINPATGQPACRINVPSAQPAGYVPPAALNPSACVPYNPFGANQSAAAMAYSFGSFLTKDKLTQQDFNINGSTDTSRFFNFQGGPLSIAFGAEYRMERTKETNDPMLLSGATEDLAANSAGGYNVYEAYVEGEAPIFKHNGPWLDDLSLDSAYRGAQYSTVGYADAYKFGGDYGPFPWIKFRGTYSQAIRAPNITEAFTPLSQTYFNVSDPCSAENIQSNVNYAKNCAAAGIPVGFTANTNSSIIGTISGNPNLKPEASISYTGGFVLQPTFAKGLSITVDYYAIKIKNAITELQPQDILDNCYNNSAGLNAQYCSLFTRGSDHNINFVQSTYLNAAKVETDGIDFQFDYTTSVAWLTGRSNYTRMFDGRLTMSMTLNWLDHYHYYPFQNNPTQVDIYEGTNTDPAYKAIASIDYRQGPWDVTWETRYLARTVNYNRNPTQADFSESISPSYAPQEFYDNIIVHYSLDKYFKGGQVYAGINDIFDALPPAYLIESASSAGYELGRYLFVGLRVRR